MTRGKWLLALRKKGQRPFTFLLRRAELKTSSKAKDLAIAIFSLKKTCKSMSIHFAQIRNQAEDGDIELRVGSNFVYYCPSTAKWQTGRAVYYKGNRYEPPSEDLSFDEADFDHYTPAIRFALGREAMESAQDFWSNECMARELSQIKD